MSRPAAEAHGEPTMAVVPDVAAWVPGTIHPRRAWHVHMWHGAPACLSFRLSARQD